MNKSAPAFFIFSEKNLSQMIRRAGNAGDDFLARFQIADANVGVVFQTRSAGDFQFLRAFELLVRLGGSKKEKMDSSGIFVKLLT